MENNLGITPDNNWKFPIAKRFTWPPRNKNIKIGDYRLIPKGKKVFSISLQENVIFEKDMVIEITHTCIGNNCVFANLMLVLFEASFPGIAPKAHGEVSVDFNETLPYKLPEPTFFDFKY